MVSSRFAILGLLFCVPCWGAPHFSIDSRADLPALSRSGEILVTSSDEGSHYEIDAAAVLPVDPERFLNATLDFERYADIGMDHVDEAHCIGGSCLASPMIFWMKLSALGISSKSYSELRSFRPIDARAHSMGATWHQVSGHWGYPESPLTSAMEGSVFVLPLGSSRADGVHGTYIRYTMAATVQTVLPNFVIARFVKHELRANISNSVRKIADRAR
jgi:hypothetical protein